MSFHYAGKFDGDPKHTYGHEDAVGAVKFKEPPYKVFIFISSILSLGILVLLMAASTWRTEGDSFSVLGFILALLSLVPHEMLHGLCFKQDVYMYTNLSKGVLFVTGPEEMSKGRFIFMSILPNLVFGFIPYCLFLLFPSLTVLGTLGECAIAFGAGDYINIFNAATQMPKNAVTYLHEMGSYWYIP